MDVVEVFTAVVMCFERATSQWFMGDDRYVGCTCIIDCVYVILDDFLIQIVLAFS